MNSNLSAFLRVIREGESSQDDSIAYRMLYGGGLVDDLSEHPNRTVTAGGWTSTAAGAYQFLYRTWVGLNLPDFSPKSQDEGAIKLIERRGALKDVLEGRFEQAIAKCNKEWASLPGSPYGQHTISMDRCKAVYEKFGGSYGIAQAAPEATEAPQPKGWSMSPFILAAVNAIAAILPEFAKSEVAKRNANAAITIAKAAVGAVNEQELVKAMEDPAQANMVKKALQDNWYTLTGASEETIQSARKFAVDYSKDRTLKDGITFVEFLSLIFVIISAVGGGYVLYGPLPAELKGAVVTLMLIGGWTGVKEFWLGSSKDSQRKTEMLSRQD